MIRRSAFWGGRRGPWAPWGGDLGGGNGLRSEVIYLNTPMGTRPGKFWVPKSIKNGWVWGLDFESVFKLWKRSPPIVPPLQKHGFGSNFGWFWEPKSIFVEAKINQNLDVDFVGLRNRFYTEFLYQNEFDNIFWLIFDQILHESKFWFNFKRTCNMLNMLKC